MAPHLSDPQYLLKCDALSCEEVVKTVRTFLGRNKELRQVRDFSPSMLLYGTLSLFRTNFRRCHALLRFVTSSLASPAAAVLFRVLGLIWLVKPVQVTSHEGFITETKVGAAKTIQTAR